MSAAKSKRATWREWVPDAGAPALITRAELLAKLEQLGVVLGASTLRSWEYQGLVPAPELGKNGTPGHYPWWMIDLVCYVRRWQHDKATPEQLRASARWEAHRLAYDDRYKHFNQLPTSAVSANWTRWQRELLLGDHYVPSSPGDLAAIVQGSASLLALYAYPLATAYARRVGQPLVGVSLQINVAGGMSVEVPLPAPAASTLLAKEEDS